MWNLSVRLKIFRHTLEETLHLDVTAEPVVIRNGSVVPPERSEQKASPLPEGTNWPYPSKVTMSEAYRFKEWKGTEDLPTPLQGVPC
jgi:hypothetical protein